MGCRCVAEVQSRSNDILYYMYHSALCHDFGKIALLDTIFVYGRPLTDTEFAIIKEHPRMGAFFLKLSSSTKEYVDLAQRHHIWYDGTKGYPLEEKPQKDENHIFCDILTIADCVDAATDIIGRNYNRGKRLEEVLEEIQAEKGMRDSNIVAEVMEEPEVVADLKNLVGQGRIMNYRNTYLLLHKHTGAEE